MKRAIITVGLGFGDESKGSWVQRLANDYKADLVVRYSGGSQCGHNVQLADGHRHTFSQFGAGTFAGVRTYLGPDVIINPAAMDREAIALQQYGQVVTPKKIEDITIEFADRCIYPYNTLLVDKRCLVSTVYHRALNKLKELLRGKSRHGSCGHGIGEVRKYWLQYGTDAIRVADIQDGINKSSEYDLHDKLALLKARLVDEASRLPYNHAAYFDDFFSCDPQVEMDRLRDVGKKFSYAVGIPSRIRTVVFEGAQGVLLDEWNGFHPHTTWSTVTPEKAMTIASDWEATEVCVLGLTRTYQTRHGNGPLPTYDEQLTQKLVDIGNPHNEWQGSFRCGWLDMPLLRYAAAACKRLDGILVSHCDQMHDTVNKLCTSYVGDPVIEPPSIPNLARQEELGVQLAAVEPVFIDADESVVNSHLATIAPVVGHSYGPTDATKLLNKLKFGGIV